MTDELNKRLDTIKQRISEAETISFEVYTTEKQRVRTEKKNGTE